MNFNKKNFTFYSKGNDLRDVVTYVAMWFSSLFFSIARVMLDVNPISLYGYPGTILFFLLLWSPAFLRILYPVFLPTVQQIFYSPMVARFVRVCAAYYIPLRIHPRQVTPASHLQVSAMVSLQQLHRCYLYEEQGGLHSTQK